MSNFFDIIKPCMHYHCSFAMFFGTKARLLLLKCLYIILSIYLPTVVTLDKTIYFLQRAIYVLSGLCGK